MYFDKQKMLFFCTKKTPTCLPHYNQLLSITAKEKWGLADFMVKRQQNVYSQFTHCLNLPRSPLFVFFSILHLEELHGQYQVTENENREKGVEDIFSHETNKYGFMSDWVSQKPDSWDYLYWKPRIEKQNTGFITLILYTTIARTWRQTISVCSASSLPVFASDLYSKWKAPSSDLLKDGSLNPICLPCA